MSGFSVFLQFRLIGWNLIFFCWCRRHFRQLGRRWSPRANFFSLFSKFRSIGWNSIFFSLCHRHYQQQFWRRWSLRVDLFSLFYFFSHLSAEYRLHPFPVPVFLFSTTFLHFFGLRVQLFVLLFSMIKIMDDFEGTFDSCSCRSKYPNYLVVD